MKKLIASLCMALFGVTVYAQQKVPLPVVCGEPEFIGKVLKEYKEEILFVGKDLIHGVKQLTLNIFLNPKTGTYSAVLVAPDASVICVVSSGEAGKILYNN